MRGVGAGLSVWSPAMDSAVGQCQGPLCGGAAYPINDVEVIVGGCFRMDCRGEFKVMSLPVVGPVFHVQFLIFLGRLNGLQCDPVTVWDPECLKVGTPVEAVVDSSAPAAAAAAEG